MYQPVTDRNGQVTGFTYTDVQGRQQFVPAVGAGAPGGRLGGLMQRQTQFGGRVAAPQPEQQNGFMFGGGVTPPPAPPSPSMQQQPSGPGGGGGSPLYQKFYSKFSAMGDQLRSNVEGAVSGTPPGPSEAAFRAGTHRQKIDMRQAAREADQRAKATAAFTNPYYYVNGVDTGNMGFADQDFYRAQPLTQLTFLMQGDQGRDRFSTNARRFGNAVNQTADQLGAGLTPNRDILMGNLFSPSPRSALGRSFMMPEAGEARYDKYGIYQGMGRTKWDWAPASSQADTMRSYLAAINQVTTRPSAQQPAMTYLNRLIDQWVASNVNKRNAPPLYKWLGNQLGY